MLFSLIVTTIDGCRTDVLLRFLTSLKDQAHAQIELVLVYQTHRNLSEIDVRKQIPALPQTSTVCVVTPCSLSRARNEGMRFATGGIVAFPDDDCWYPPLLLPAVEERLKREDLDGVSGSVYDPLRSRTYGKRPLELRTRITLANAFVLPTSVGLFIRRDCLPTDMMFDERLGAGTRWGGAEEVDLVCRLLDAGAKLAYDGSLVVYHEVPPYVPSDIPKYLHYGRGLGAAVAKRLLAGHAAPLLVLLENTARCIAGSIVSATSGSSGFSKLYVNRGVGALQGFLEGIRFYRSGAFNARP